MEKTESLTYGYASASKLSESDVVSWALANLQAANNTLNGEVQNDHFQVLIEEAKTVAETTSVLKANPNSNAAQEARDQLREKKKSLREKLHQCNWRPDPRSAHNDDRDELMSPCTTHSSSSSDGGFRRSGGRPRGGTTFGDDDGTNVVIGNSTAQMKADELDSTATQWAMTDVLDSSRKD